MAPTISAPARATPAASFLMFESMVLLLLGWSGGFDPAAGVRLLSPITTPPTSWVHETDNSATPSPTNERCRARAAPRARWGGDRALWLRNRVPLDGLGGRLTLASRFLDVAAVVMSDSNRDEAGCQQPDAHGGNEMNRTSIGTMRYLFFGVGLVGGLILLAAGQTLIGGLLVAMGTVRI